MNGNGDGQISDRQFERMKKLASKNFGRFAVSMQQLSEDVQLKLIAQLPEFRQLANDALKSLDENFQATLKSNGPGEEAVHRSFEARQRTLEELLSDPDLSLQERLQVTSEIGKCSTEFAAWVAERGREKHALYRNAVFGTLAVVTTVVVAVVGGKAMLDQENSPEA